MARDTVPGEREPPDSPGDPAGLDRDAADLAPEAAGDEPTVCAECVYFYNVTPNLNAMPLALCTNPMFARPARLDFVTGRTLNETRPRCETINDGRCPGFVKDNSRIVLLILVGLILAVGFWYAVAFPAIPVPGP